MCPAGPILIVTVNLTQEESVSDFKKQNNNYWFIELQVYDIKNIIYACTPWNFAKYILFFQDKNLPSYFKYDITVFLLLL